VNSAYRLTVSRDSLKFIAKQTRTVQERIHLALTGLSVRPPIGDIKPLKTNSSMAFRTEGTIFHKTRTSCAFGFGPSFSSLTTNVESLPNSYPEKSPQAYFSSRLLVARERHNSLSPELGITYKTFWLMLLIRSALPCTNAIKSTIYPASWKSTKRTSVDLALFYDHLSYRQFPGACIRLTPPPARTDRLCHLH